MGIGRVVAGAITDNGEDVFVHCHYASDKFTRLIFLFAIIASILQLDVVFTNPSFIGSDNPLKKFIALLWSFPINTFFSLGSPQFWHHFFSNFQVFSQNLAKPWLSEAKWPFGDHRVQENAHNWCFRFCTRQRSILILLSLGVFPAFSKTLNPLEHCSFHRDFAIFDEFLDNSCSVSQDIWYWSCVTFFYQSLFRQRLKMGFTEGARINHAYSHTAVILEINRVLSSGDWPLHHLLLFCWLTAWNFGSIFHLLGPETLWALFGKEYVSACTCQTLLSLIPSHDRVLLVICQNQNDIVLTGSLPWAP